MILFMSNIKQLQVTCIQLGLQKQSKDFELSMSSSAETNSNFYYSNSCEQNDQIFFKLILLLNKY